jgi:hypothetical protein
MIPNQMVDKRGFIDFVCTCFTSSYFSNPFMVKTAKLCAFFGIIVYLLKETPYGWLSTTSVQIRTVVSEIFWKCLTRQAADGDDRLQVMAKARVC